MARTVASEKKRKAQSNGKSYKKAKTNLVTSKAPKSFTVTGPTSNVMSVKLLYADTYTLNPGVAGVGANQVFRLGSIFDPDRTGVGHQPMGFDQLFELYERYQVWRVDFEIEFSFGASSTSTEICGVGYRMSDSDSTSTDPRVVLEQGAGEFASVTGTSSIKRFNGSVKLNDIHGVTYKQYMSNDDYGSTFGTNPVEDTFMHIFADGYGSDTGPVSARVRLTFHAKLMGSKLQSLN